MFSTQQGPVFGLDDKFGFLTALSFHSVPFAKDSLSFHYVASTVLAAVEAKGRKDVKFSQM